MPGPRPLEFGQRAVQFALEGTAPVAKIAKDSGISESCRRNWLAQADDDENGSGERLSSLRRRNWPICGGGTGCWSRRASSRNSVAAVGGCTSAVSARIGRTGVSRATAI